MQIGVSKRTPVEKLAAEQSKAFRRTIDRNIPLTDNVCIGLDMRRHMRNLNVLLVGGSGKSRFFCKLGLMQANYSYLVCDPNGERVLSLF